MSFSALKGSNTNWSSGIKTPIIADNKGTLNVLWATGIFWGRILPFDILHWGVVGDINGYLTPFAKLGEYKLLNPNKFVWFGTDWFTVVVVPVES